MAHRWPPHQQLASQHQRTNNHMRHAFSFYANPDYFQAEPKFLNIAIDAIICYNSRYAFVHSCSRLIFRQKRRKRFLVIFQNHVKRSHFISRNFRVFRVEKSGKSECVIMMMVIFNWLKTVVRAHVTGYVIRVKSLNSTYVNTSLKGY